MSWVAWLRQEGSCSASGYVPATEKTLRSQPSLLTQSLPPPLHQSAASSRLPSTGRFLSPAPVPCEAVQRRRVDAARRRGSKPTTGRKIAAAATAGSTRAAAAAGRQHLPGGKSTDTPGARVCAVVAHKGGGMVQEEGMRRLWRLGETGRCTTASQPIHPVRRHSSVVEGGAQGGQDSFYRPCLGASTRLQAPPSAHLQAPRAAAPLPACLRVVQISALIMKRGDRCYLSRKKLVTIFL